LYDEQGEESKQTTLAVLWRVFHDTLIMLHPFMPFVTEEIWHKYPGTKGSIMKAVYPLDDPDFGTLNPNPKVEQTMTLTMDVITAVRNIRGEMNISPSQALKVTIQTSDESARELIGQQQDLIIDLARLENLSIEMPGAKPPATATAIIDQITLFVSLAGIVDFEKEEQRLEKEILKLAKELSSVSNKLQNENFLSKAPEEIVAKVRQKHDTLQQKKAKLDANLDKIRTYS